MHTEHSYKNPSFGAKENIQKLDRKLSPLNHCRRPIKKKVEIETLKVKMKSAIILISFAFFALTSAGNRQIDWYDCSNKAEGNYAHPIDCTRFLICTNGAAYEMECAICDYDPVTCPQGRLVFDGNTNMCLYANEAVCTSLCDRPDERSFRAGKLL